MLRDWLNVVCLLCLQTRAMADKTSELKQKHQAAVAGLMKRYMQLRSEVANYNKALETVMSKQSGGVAAGNRQHGAADIVSRDQ